MSAKEKEKILTKDLRTSLKELMQKEMKGLPKLIESLEPEKRINILCKLMPYVYPKVENISSKDGEPFSMDWD